MDRNRHDLQVRLASNITGRVQAGTLWVFSVSGRSEASVVQPAFLDWVRSDSRRFPGHGGIDCAVDGLNHHRAVGGTIVAGQGVDGRLNRMTGNASLNVFSVSSA